MVSLGLRGEGRGLASSEESRLATVEAEGTDGAGAVLLSVAVKAWGKDWGELDAIVVVVVVVVVVGEERRTVDSLST
jgi:hypothetical protein